MDFRLYPTYDKYRTLRLSAPMMQGYDVFALQTALVEMELDVGGLDGIFGGATNKAVKESQKVLGITVDGLVGGGTQQAIVKRLANRARTINNLPPGLVFGQCMHESSCRIGNYSPARSDGSYDAGPTQMNSSVHPLSLAFNVEMCIEELGRYLRARYDGYRGLFTDRRWELASGAWNAPAWSAWLAKREGATVSAAWLPKVAPTQFQIATLEKYIQSATAFMVI